MLIGGAIASLHWTVPRDVHLGRQCAATDLLYLCRSRSNPYQPTREEGKLAWPKELTSKEFTQSCTSNILPGDSIGHNSETHG